MDDKKKIGIYVIIQTSTLRKKPLTTVDKKDVSSSSLNDSSDPPRGVNCWVKLMYFFKNFVLECFNIVDIVEMLNFIRNLMYS